MSSEASDDLFGEREQDDSDAEAEADADLDAAHDSGSAAKEGDEIGSGKAVDVENGVKDTTESPSDKRAAESSQGNDPKDRMEVDDNDDDDEDDEDEAPRPSPRPRSHTSIPLPEPPDDLLPHKTSRSSLFRSILNPSRPNYSLSLDPISITTLTTPCHVLASTPCLGYLLAGCQDGHVRAYDFWASVQGKAVMSTVQKQTANLGDAVTKGGVSRGWWRNEVEVDVWEDEVDSAGDVTGSILAEGKKPSGKNATNGGPASNSKSYEDFKKRKQTKSTISQPPSATASAFGFLAPPPPLPASARTSNPFGLPDLSVGLKSLGAGAGAGRKKFRIKRLEPVYAMAVQSEGLWAVSGSTSGSINLTSMRHSPGKLIHTLGLPPAPSEIAPSPSSSNSYHNGAISTLSLLPGERGMLSGGWDKTVKEWDLETGKVVRTYSGHGDAISAVEVMPYARGGAVNRQAKGGLTISISGATQTEEEVGVAADTADVEKRDEPDGPQEDGVDKDVEMTSPKEALESKGEAKSPVPEKTGSPAADSDEEGSLFAFDDDEDRDAAGEPDEDADGEEEMLVDPVVLPPEAPKDTPPPPAPLIAKEVLSRKRRFGDFAFAQRPTSNLPILTPETYNDFSNDITMVASIDGEVALHDRRVGQSKVGRLEAGERTAPWCMSACFSSDGSQVIAGRQHGTLDVWDVRRMGGGSGSGSAPSLLKTLKNPMAAKEISAVAAFPDARYIACAGNDCVRLWNTHELWDPESSIKRSKSTVPFRLVAGHHGGMVSQILIDPTGRFMLTASGNRGWQGDTTRVILAHEIKR